MVVIEVYAPINVKIQTTKEAKSYFIEVNSLKNVGGDRFLVKLRYSRFYSPSIRNLLNPPALTPYISKTTLNFAKL